jgi:hydrogenase/urease accessory protein HupE
MRGPALVCAALSLALVCATGLAGAHTLGISRGDYTPEGNVVRVELELRAEEAALSLSGLDTDGDRIVTAENLARARPAVKAAFLDPLAIAADGEPCVPALDDASLDPPEGLSLRATYTCPHAPSHLHLRFGFLDRMAGDHRHLARVHLPNGDVDDLAVLERPDLDVDVSSGASHGFASLFRGGVEHILTGADHLAFLLALVLGGTLVADRRTRVGSLVAMLTAFTVGHSASLAIATLGGFAPGARLVEPAVALSVAYVGAENLFTRSVRHRWMLTLPFGFVHGFAFAGGLLPLGLARAQLPVALLAFNLGVEGGQLFILLVLLPPLTYLAARAWYPRLAMGLSAGIALAGLVWFVQRVV